MDFYFLEYSDDQRKTYINSEMQYKSYLERVLRFNKSFRFRMGWNKANGKEYLFKECLDTKKRVSLGRKSEETVAIYNAFNQQKKELKASLKQSKELLLKNEKINKFTKIGRVPNILVKFFRRINELGLDDKIIIIGTNALYVYEAYCGVFIEEEHLATFDIDVFNKRDKKISFALKEKLPQKTLKSILLDVDKSTDSFSGVINLEIAGTKWLESSKLHKQMLIGQNGQCAFVTTIAPLEYAVYKKWLGEHERKDLMKKQRDIKQSQLVTQLIQKYVPVIDIAEELKSMKNMSSDAIEQYKREILC